MNFISILFQKYKKESSKKRSETSTSYRHLIALEPRFMFDAAGAVTAVEVASEQVVNAQVNAFMQENFSTTESVFIENESTQSFDIAQLPPSSNRANEDINSTATEAEDEVTAYPIDDFKNNDRVEIAFIDLSIDNADQLASALDQSIEIIFIDSEKGGIEQIADALEGRTDIDAIHILSHGDKGVLSIAGTQVTADSIKGEQASLFLRIGQSLSEDGDMLVYGCNFAAGAEGSEAIKALADTTKADIAASNNITGAADKGGDWVLETQLGEINNATLVAEDFSGTLETTPVNTSGPQTGEYVVTADGVITITIQGGDGGNGSGSDGGQGATVTGTFNVTAGQIIRFVVGEAGDPIDSGTGTSAGGGGSTGVFIDDVLVLVAGAGGGGDDAIGGGGGGGNSVTFGDDGSGVAGGAAGTNGNGGGGTGTAAGSGGGGINSAGQSGLGTGGSAADLTPNDGVTLANGGTGDLSGSDGGRGLTGGGGASPSFSGGGGGYSGGGSAGGNGGGGGGGSFVHASAISNSVVAGTDAAGSESDGNIKVSLEANSVPVIYLNNDGDTETAVGWQHNSPFNTPSATDFNSGSVVSGSDEMFGPGLSGIYDNTRVQVEGVTASDLATARANQDFILYGFTTASDFANPVSINAIYNADWIETVGYKIAIDISSDNFTTFNTLIEDHQAAVAGGSTYDGVFQNIDHFEISANTNYQMRVYLYDSDGGTVIFDDLQIFTTSPEYNFNNTFTENGPPVAIASTDIAIDDDDNTNMASASIVLANPQTDDRLLVNGSAATSGTLSSGITYTLTSTTVTLSGIATLADYEAAIQTIEFENTGENPSVISRSIEVTVNDSESNSNTAIATIEVIPINDAPVATNDGPISVDQDTPVNGNVLTNDTDVDSDTITVTQFVIAGNGTVYNAGTTATINGVGSLLINNNGTFTFTPNTDYTGPVPSATYTISDGDGSTDTATLSFSNVIPANDAPIANNDGPVSVTEDTPVSGNVLSNDTDANNDTLAVTQFIIDGDTTVYSAGTTAALAGIGRLLINANGTFTFTPDTNYNGPVPSATYTITDNNGGTDTAILSFSNAVPANDAPEAVNDGPISVTEDTPVNGNVLTNDTDIDGDTLNVTQFVIDGDTTVYNSGTTATIAGVGALLINADGSFTFTPATNYTGPVPSATYTITDNNGGTDTAILSFSNMVPANDAPEAINDGPISVTEDTPATGNVLTNDTDIDGDTLAVTQFVIAGDTT
ncbi:DUF4347 domain-containing protein, partial [Pseudoalteromonas sp. SWXJZ94C]|uniref:Ig-like domain-containing protein n=1 Tax=Pseudoalteromonas sp. SWXJZ94C TaxID=2792065 RepID=UPI0018CCD048